MDVIRLSCHGSSKDLFCKTGVRRMLGTFPSLTSSSPLTCFFAFLFTGVPSMPVPTFPPYHVMPMSPPYLLPVPSPSPLLPPLSLSQPTAPPPTGAAMHAPSFPLWTSSSASPLFSFASVFSLAVMSVAQSLLPAVSAAAVPTGPLYTSSSVPQSPGLCPPGSAAAPRFTYPEVVPPLKSTPVTNGTFEPPASPGWQPTPSTPTTGRPDGNLVSSVGLEYSRVSVLTGMERRESAVLKYAV